MVKHQLVDFWIAVLRDGNQEPGLICALSSICGDCLCVHQNLIKIGNLSRTHCKSDIYVLRIFKE